MTLFAMLLYVYVMMTTCIVVLAEEYPEVA
jgi:hypothetical protein